ncbi:Histidine decarboxylase [Oopsacas minuta]|uniref:Histidine decarboxylase n=1 Tax=Oopsacas minuta TaxID=111878 RepID=A0AAV7KB50_9METZ|nr:Histidine decarboxylase [Oopsacas minuta]
MDSLRAQNYVAELKKKYQTLPPVIYQLGYPGNFKDQQLNIEAKLEISKIQPFITNSGSSLNIKEVPWISSVEVESDIILRLIAPWGGKEENTWAYITTGGTEGNIAGVHFGLKELYPYKPILIYSNESHFSISKAIELTKGQFSAILQIPTLRNGEINCKQIEPNVRNVIDQQDSAAGDIPSILVVATLGTTMKGACDDVCSILISLYSMGVTRDKIFVHLDAAFHGGFWHLDNHNPQYQIGIEFNSIAISGWKWYGADICGLFAIYQRTSCTYSEQGFREYLSINDIGITSTRNGLNAISWIIRFLQFDWQEEYNHCQKIVKYAVKQFQSLDIETFVNPASLTICTPTLPTLIIKKYCLACYDDGHLGKICHIIICPHVTEGLIDILVTDLRECIGEMKKTSWFK